VAARRAALRIKALGREAGAPERSENG
jgi:hypothetical protein